MPNFGHPALICLDYSLLILCLPVKKISSEFILLSQVFCGKRKFRNCDLTGVTPLLYFPFDNLFTDTRVREDRVRNLKVENLTGFCKANYKIFHFIHLCTSKRWNLPTGLFRSELCCIHSVSNLSISNIESFCNHIVCKTFLS